MFHYVDAMKKQGQLPLRAVIKNNDEEKIFFKGTKELLGNVDMTLSSTANRLNAVISVLRHFILYEHIWRQPKHAELQRIVVKKATEFLQEGAKMMKCVEEDTVLYLQYLCYEIIEPDEVVG